MEIARSGLCPGRRLLLNRRVLANLGWAAAAITPVAAALLLVPRALWKRWSARVVDRVDLGLRRGVTRFGRHYREYTRASLKFIDLKGLAVVGFHTPEFDDVFVDVGLAYQAPHHAPTGLLSRLSAGGRHAVTEFLDRPDPVVLAIIGVPGSGKTTLLRHLALTVSRARRGRRRIPILLYLRDHVAEIVAGAELATLVRDRLGRYGPQEPPGWFEQRLRRGDCLVLLDGLDEVADKADRRKVSDWVERQTAQYPGNDYVLTSRPHGYLAAPVNGAAVLQVRDFTDEQVTGFVRGWYSAIEKLSTRDDGRAVRLRAEAAADELLDKLHANSTLYDLTVNPLLLTMVANVHRFGSKLPDSRAELYREICEVMLWRRHEAKNLPVRLDGNRKEVVLRALAFTMMERRVRDVSRADVLARFKPMLLRMSTSMTEEALLEDVSSNGLLVERESGVFSFAHLTFQEYLAAAHARELGDLSVLAAKVDDDWWREAIVLGVARTSADPVVQACVEQGSVGALALALDCAEVCNELSPELREQLARLADALAEDPEQRQLVAGIMLTRLGREMVRVGDARVYARPVTNTLYGLYLRYNDRPVPPDVEPAAPVRGVWSSDANAFVTWANAMVGDRTAYRLPSAAEAEAPAVRRGLAKVGRPYWLRSGATHPAVARRLDVERMAVRAASDIDPTGVVPRLLLLDHVSVLLDLEPVPPVIAPGSLRSVRVGGGHERSAADLIAAIALASELGLDLGFLTSVAHRLAWVASARWPKWRSKSEQRTLADQVREVRDAQVGERDEPVVHMLGLGRGYRLGSLGVVRDPRAATEAFVGKAMTRYLDSMLAWVATPDSARSALPDGGTSILALVKTGPGDVDPVQLVADVMGDVHGLRTGLWDPNLPERVREAARPVVVGGEPLTREVASVIRLGALCVAAELDETSPADAGRYRRIAAGTTYLECRRAGEVAADETIVLATDRGNR
ncbi:hypothetical protein BN6_72760 [Saccharothrix espanaensis DSM 44229]|uniref:NACHT domain-containing protein n=1 Tax=Saccharothrix espanaensis (strain ATCC 51144 / DSM 44229 / JCM 9112 / NBRC 15066 / NRRL 15764) TaxID=1179773 RepID=K0KD81_SACES|nr:hypothetical protein BN6_72760 [Saccharothrix espanaensis DSM 44229]